MIGANYEFLFGFSAESGCTSLHKRQLQVSGYLGSRAVLSVMWLCYGHGGGGGAAFGGKAM